MTTMTQIQTSVRKHALRAVARVLPYVPEDWVFAAVRRWVDDIPYEAGRVFARRLIHFGRELMRRVSPNCRKKAIENFLINNYFAGLPKRRALHTQLGCDAPYLIVVSPTMRCNLRCFGCYAGDYSRRDDLPRELFEKALREARDLGIYFITISGGEPFIREDLLEVFAKFDDQYFQVYTNGTLIDDALARQLAELGNVFPAISVEGFEKETDARRGKGTFKKILAAMANLRRHGVPFGYSATATRLNNDLIVSDEFVDFWAEQGCFLGWYFNYIPIGYNPDPDLMPTPEQRVYRIKRLAELRRTRKILLADFWNDGPLVGGCMAAGKYYLHVNVRGDVEPCVFAHFAVDNIRNKSLRDILLSDFFREIRARQPFNDNHLRACMIIDNPNMLRELVAKCGARPTHPNAESIIRDFADHMDRYAEQYGRLADECWRTYRGLDPEDDQGEA